MSAADLPFDVPEFDGLVLRLVGRGGETVLTVEVQLFNAVIHEWYEPLFWRREWTYRTLPDAIGAVITWYFSVESWPEPAGWIRAVDQWGTRRHGAFEYETEG